MSNPSKSIPNNKDQKELYQGEPNKQASDELKDGQACPNDMKPSTGEIGVLREVEGVELFESLVVSVGSEVVCWFGGGHGGGYLI